jgi:hypothetical protein
MEKKIGGFGGGLGSDLGFIKTGQGTADSFSQNFGQPGQKRSVDQRSDGNRSNVSKGSSVGFALKDALKGRFGGKAKKSPMGESQGSDEGKFGAPTLKML